MADKDNKQAKAAQHVPKDAHGNPEGTTYTETGKAQPEDMGLIDLPEGKAYNEDGSVFEVPADAAKVVGTYKAEIAGLVVAINSGQNMVEAATKMFEMADEESKPAFDKMRYSQQIAVESNKAKMAESKALLAEYELKLITPARRADERLLAKLIAEHRDVTDRLTAHQNKMKVHGVETASKKETIAGEKPKHEKTQEQIDFTAAAIKEYGTQGAAVQAWTKAGWTIKQITEKTGIPSPNIVGPRNIWIRSAEGAAYENIEGSYQLKK